MIEKIFEGYKPDDIDQELELARSKDAQERQRESSDLYKLEKRIHQSTNAQRLSNYSRQYAKELITNGRYTQNNRRMDTSITRQLTLLTYHSKWKKIRIIFIPTSALIE